MKTATTAIRPSPAKAPASKPASSPASPSSFNLQPSSFASLYLPSLAFPLRTSLLASEIAAALRVDDYHINRTIAATPHKPAQYGTAGSAIRLPIARYHAWLWDILLLGTNHHPRTLRETLAKLPTPAAALKIIPEEILAAIPRKPIKPTQEIADFQATLKIEDLHRITGQSEREIYKEVAEANILALDVKGPGATRPTIRIPLDLALAYIAQGLTRGAEYTPCPREGHEDTRQQRLFDN